MFKKMIMGAALALAAMAGVAMAQDVPTLKFCSGAKGGVYDFTAEVLKQQLAGTVDVVNVNTAGSMENLQKIASGDCDAAAAQSDSLYLYGKENPNALDLIVLENSLYTEYFHLICNRKSGVTQFSDLNKGTLVYSGGRGSGSDVSLRGLIASDIENGGADYKEVPISNEGGAAALIKLNGGKGACLAYTGAPGGKFVTGDASRFAESLVIVPVEDKDFNDAEYTDSNGVKQSVWSNVVMPYSSYGKLMPSGTFGRKDVNTMGVAAEIVISSAWSTANPDAFGEVGLSIPDVKNLVRSTKKLQ
jgi:TRAP transporter TAXI family solute receptor